MGYAPPPRLGRLHLALLNKFGVDTDSFGRSEEPLPGLDGSDFQPYQEREFESWVRVEGKKITVQGRLRMSDNLDEAKIFFVDVAGQTPVRVEVGFRDFHRFNLAYHCGTAIILTGAGESQGETRVIKKVEKLESLFGKIPGSAKG